MAKIFLAIVIILGITYFVLTQTGSDQDTNTNQDQQAQVDNTNDDDSMMDDDSMDSDDQEDNTDDTTQEGDVTYVEYENKAHGYTINRPDNWYWQHFHSAVVDGPFNVDYFATDPLSPPRLGSEYLGQIVIEVSDRDITDYQDAVTGLNSVQVNVAGQSATRYDGTVTNNVVENQKRIEYQFVYNGSTYRLMYVNNENSEEAEAIFETVVSSLELN